MGEHFDYSDFAANFVDRHKYVLEVSTFGFLASIFMFMKFATRDLDIILRSKGDRISPSVDFSHSEVPALRSYFATRSLYWCFTILAPFAVTAAADPGAYDVVFQSTLIPLILITTVPPLYLYHLLQEPPPSMARVAPATPPA
jgi:hypothetical protein